MIYYNINMNTIIYKMEDTTVFIKKNVIKRAKKTAVVENAATGGK